VAAGEAAFGASVSNGAGAPYEFSPIPGLVLLGAGYCANYLEAVAGQK